MLQINVKANPLDSKNQLKPGWIGEQVQRTGAFTYDTGNNLDEAISKFGKDLIFGKFNAQVTIDAAGVARSMLEANKTPTEIQAFLNTWKPGMGGPKLVKVMNISEMSVEDIGKLDFSALSEEQFAAIRARIQAARDKKKQ
jgi:hypothetical protein